MNELTSQFLSTLLSELLLDCYAAPVDNLDLEAVAVSQAEAADYKRRSRIANLAKRAGFSMRGFYPPTAREMLSRYLPYVEGFAETWAALGDDASREMMKEVLRFQIVGKRHVKLRTNSPAFWENRRKAKEEFRVERAVMDVPGRKLDRFQFPVKEGALDIVQFPPGFSATFLAEQYSYRRGNVNIAVRPGDIVMDGGAAYGDTALYFSAATGPSGKVIAFEFEPNNLRIFERNLKTNPHFSPRITLAQNALWSVSDETLHFDPAGVGTTVSSTGALEVKTVSIDDYVQRNGVERIDFIKLDIEGAELETLKGAAETLRKFRPRLAVCVYHKPEDLSVIPAFIRGLDVGYQLYLDHFSINEWETVLFAESPGK